MRKVLIIQSEMKHYRLPFFTKLHAALRDDGIDLTVVYSNSNALHALRKDRADLDPSVGYQVEGRWFFGRLLYQPIWREVAAADLVIVGPELKYLINPLLVVASKIGLKNVAYWGLGPNRHPDRSATAEWLKKHFYTDVDWWFAYTESVADYLRSRGMEKRRITVVQNASDTTELRDYMRAIADEDVAAATLSLTGNGDSMIALYSGLLGPIKSIPLLLEAARLVKRRCPGFHLLIIGDGPDKAWLLNAIRHDPWVHFLGFHNHRDSAVYYRMADVSVIAGTVGLAVVDAFAAGVPLIVTDLSTHPPEISYIVNGHNGLVVPHNADSLAESILAVLSDPALRQTLRNGARDSGTQYTMEAMVSKFRQGIRECLKSHNGPALHAEQHRPELGQA
jgi:glycosyltransferase involved in cell wall biosynthesis